MIVLGFLGVLIPKAAICVMFETNILIHALATGTLVFEIKQPALLNAGMNYSKSANLRSPQTPNSGGFE